MNKEALVITIINEDMKANREEKEISIDEALQDAERITNDENVWENRDGWKTLSGYNVTPQELKLWKTGTTLTWFALINGKSYMIK